MRLKIDRDGLSDILRNMERTIETSRPTNEYCRHIGEHVHKNLAYTPCYNCWLHNHYSSILFPGNAYCGVSMVELFTDGPYPEAGI